MRRGGRGGEWGEEEKEEGERKKKKEEEEEEENVPMCVNVGTSISTRFEDVKSAESHTPSPRIPLAVTMN
jgi:hypothetical protein